MGRFNVILSDSPWRYSDRAGKRGADKKYAVMSTQDLMLLRVGDLGAKNCACFMWVTGPFLPVGIRMMKAYGFAYKNVVFTWVKTNPKKGTLFSGMGHYSRGNCEYVILGTRGRLERKAKNVSSVIMAPRCKHSAKPPEVRERIVDLFGDVPRVELFARETCPGWESTGLEADGLDVREYIEREAPARDKLAALLART